MMGRISLIGKVISNKDLMRIKNLGMCISDEEPSTYKVEGIKISGSLSRLPWCTQ